MKITSEKDQQSQYVVRIEIEPGELDSAKTQAAKKLSNQLRIPGFRPGKAPRALVERFVGQEGLVEQATKDLLPKAYQNALKQESITPIGDPEINIESTDPLVIVATIPIEPTVELGKYEDIRFELPPVNVTDEDVQKIVDQLIEQQSTWEEPETERPAEEGDQVDLEMQTIRNGVPTGEPFPRTGVLGKGELLGQIDDQVKGMSVNEEKVIEVNRATPNKVTPATAEDEAAAEEAAQDLPEVETIPLDEEETVAAAPMTFNVKLNSIKVQHRPELTDELAQSVTDVQTVEALLERIRTNLHDQQEANNKRDLTDKIIKEAVAISTVVMPPILVESEVHALEHNMEQRLKQQKLTLDQYLKMVGKDHAAYHEELHPQAEERVKTALVLREIARKENISVEQTDLDREVEKMVDQFTLDAPESEREERSNAMRVYMTQEQQLENLREQLFSQKLSDRLIELATGSSAAEIATSEETPAEIAVEAAVENKLAGKPNPTDEPAESDASEVVEIAPETPAASKPKATRKKAAKPAETTEA